MSIGWDESVPSGTSFVGQAPQQFGSAWTAISVGFGIQGDLLWNGTGGASDASTGVLKAGGSRAFFAAQSASSVPSQGTARAFLASDTSRLLVYESAGTYLGGTPFLLEYGSSVASNRAVIRQSGVTFIPSGSTTTLARITFPIPFSSVGPVTLTSSDTRYLINVDNLIQSAFDSTFSWFAGGTQSAFTLEWWATGTVPIGVV